MKARFYFPGLDELKLALRTLPADLTAEAGRIIEASANAAAVRVRTNYGAHVVTGNLQESVGVRHYSRGRFGAGAKVEARAKHAHLFEYGTKGVRKILGRGMYRSGTRGRMPAAPVAHQFYPTVDAERTRMYRDLQALVARHGLVVSGDL